MRHFIVYQTTNNVTGKIYVGHHETGDLDDGYLGSGRILRRAVSKYGKENFTRITLRECANREEMLQVEQWIVNEQFIARADTYNVTVGGFGGWFHLNRGPSKDRNAMLRRDWCGRNVGTGHRSYFSSEESFQRNKAGLLRIGRPQNLIKQHTDITRRKISEANRITQAGDRNSQFGTMWIFHVTERRSIKIAKSELEIYLERGWKSGRVLNWAKHQMDGEPAGMPARL